MNIPYPEDMKCEHPDHSKYKGESRNSYKELHLHSTHLYWKEEEKNRPYFWACNDCLMRDYKLSPIREYLQTDKSPYKGTFKSL